jgi:hypothetical protein
LAEDIPSLMGIGAYGVAISGALTFSESREEIIQFITQKQEAYV